MSTPIHHFDPQRQVSVADGAADAFERWQQARSCVAGAEVAQLTRVSRISPAASADAPAAMEEMARQQTYLQFVAAHGYRGNLTTLIAGAGMYMRCAHYRKHAHFADDAGATE